MKSNNSKTNNKVQKFKGGLAYSTNTSLKLDSNESEKHGTLAPALQKLIVKLDTKKHAGKKITLVNNFVGTDEEMELLAKLLKTKCGTGGGIDEGVIFIQGDAVQKVKIVLEKEGYGVK
jgi:translation initiation factor 1